MQCRDQQNYDHWKVYNAAYTGGLSYWGMGPYALVPHIFEGTNCKCFSNFNNNKYQSSVIPEIQLTMTCSNSTIETLEKGVKFVQS